MILCLHASPDVWFFLPRFQRHATDNPARFRRLEPTPHSSCAARYLHSSRGLYIEGKDRALNLIRNGIQVWGAQGRSFAPVFKKIRTYPDGRGMALRTESCPCLQKPSSCHNPFGPHVAGLKDHTHKRRAWEWLIEWPAETDASYIQWRLRASLSRSRVGFYNLATTTEENARWMPNKRKKVTRRLLSKLIRLLWHAVHQAGGRFAYAAKKWMP